MLNKTTIDKTLEQIDLVLEKHLLKKTTLRRNILLAFVKAKSSLTQAELIAAVSKEIENVDRVSIYRNLMNLKDAGVLHEVDSNNYVYCSHECGAHAHLLLFCQSCRKHQEVRDHQKIHRFMGELGEFRFFGKKQPIFLRGICAGCA